MQISSKRRILWLKIYTLEYPGGGKRVKTIFAGVNGTPRKVKKVYVGVNGVPKLVWSDVEDGQQVFTTSGIFVVPDGVSKVDIFCVGGGGKAGIGQSNIRGAYDLVNEIGGGGGGGGYTKTMLGVTLSNAAYPVTVGASGGASSFGTICVAASGQDGAGVTDIKIPQSAPNNARGGNGGSGGGGGGFYHAEDDTQGTAQPTAGASNGSNAANTRQIVTRYSSGGIGQGTTTRAFGEPTGTLYSPGSGGKYGGKRGGGQYAASGSGITGPNTGAGNSISDNIFMGGYNNAWELYETKTGYSGVVIIRWYANQQ